MKKVYINPNLTVVKINMQSQLLSGSGVTTNSEGDVQSVGFGGDYDGGGLKSRRGGLWDDDED